MTDNRTSASGDVYRLAEKSRNSTCRFADRVASLSIAEFKKRCPAALENAYEQTVLSAILVEVPSHNNATVDASSEEEDDVILQVVSLGVGTKFLTSLYCTTSEVAETKPLVLHPCYWSSVRDSHAEVLARRSFLHFLYSEIELLLVHSPSSPPHISDVFLPLSEDVALSGKLNIFHLRPEVRFHMYTSSQPCGNACVKKFAKGSKAVFRDNLSSSQYPRDEHPRLQVTAKAQGQVACLLKKGSLTVPTLFTPELISRHQAEDPPHVTSSGQGGEELELAAGSATTHPPGTVPPGSGLGFIKTCSDKIAMWNALGIQGGLLSHLIAEPVYLSTITIGRKYSKVHAERALCCRLQDFRFSDATYTHHPVIMCSSVKFDEKFLSVQKPLSLPMPPQSLSLSSLSESDKLENPTKRHKEDHKRDEHTDSDAATSTASQVSAAASTCTSSTPRRGVLGASFSERRCLFWARREEAGVLNGCTGFMDLGDTDSSADMGESCQSFLNRMTPSISSKSLFRRYMICSSLIRGRGDGCSQKKEVLRKTESEEDDYCFSLSSYKYVKCHGVLPPNTQDTNMATRTSDSRDSYCGHAISSYVAAKNALLTDNSCFLKDVEREKPFCNSCGALILVPPSTGSEGGEKCNRIAFCCISSK